MLKYGNQYSFSLEFEQISLKSSEEKSLLSEQLEEHEQLIEQLRREINTERLKSRESMSKIEYFKMQVKNGKWNRKIGDLRRLKREDCLAILMHNPPHHRSFLQPTFIRKNVIEMPSEFYFQQRVVPDAVVMKQKSTKLKSSSLIRSSNCAKNRSNSKMSVQ